MDLTVKSTLLFRKIFNIGNSSLPHPRKTTESGFLRFSGGIET